MDEEESEESYKEKNESNSDSGMEGLKTYSTRTRTRYGNKRGVQTFDKSTHE